MAESEQSLNFSRNGTGVANQILVSDALSIIYLAIGVFGFVSNAYVIIVIALYKPMHKQLTNLYVVNQSLIDSTVAIFLFFTTLFYDTGSQTRQPGNWADEAICRLWYTKMPLWGMLVASTYGIIALTLERFIAVVYPIWHKTNYSKNKVYISITIAFTWIFGPAYNIAYSSPISKITDEGRCTVWSEWPDPTTATAVIVFTFFVQFLFPLIFLAIGYSKMVLVLHRRVDVGEGHGGKAPEGGDKKETKKNASMARARGNVIKTLAIVACFFIFCWIWNQVYYVLFQLGVPGLNFTNNFYSFTVVMVFVNCCVNPVIYTINYAQFQTAVLQVVLRRKPTRNEEKTISTVA